MSKRATFGIRQQRENRVPVKFSTINDSYSTPEDSQFGVRRDLNLTNLVTVNTMKVPVILGFKNGVVGDIIFNVNDNTFYGYTIGGWIPISGGGGGGGVTNVGNGAEIYTENGVAPFELRTLISSDSSITIVQSGDTLDLKVIGGGGGSQNLAQVLSIGDSANNQNITNVANILALNGSVGSPAYSFTLSPSVGMWSPGSNQLAFSTNGAERMRINEYGRVGIDNSSPIAKFHINYDNDNPSSALAVLQLNNINFNAQTSLNFCRYDALFGRIRNDFAGNMNYVATGGGDHFFWNGGDYDFPGSIVPMIIKASGNVGIGINPPTEKLHVNGNILATGTITPSDYRIKEQVQSIDTAWALNILDNLNPVSYYFIDKTINSDLEYGYIAQQINQLLPFSTCTINHVIPNIFKHCSYSLLQENLFAFSCISHGLIQGDQVQINFNNLETSLNCLVGSVLDTTESGFNLELLQGKMVANTFGDAFVYGKMVNNFMAVDMAEINAIHVAATKNLSINLFKAQQEISELKAELKEMKQLISKLVPSST